MGRLESPPLKSPRIVAIPIAFNEELKIASVLDRFAEVNELTLRSFEDRLQIGLHKSSSKKARRSFNTAYKAEGAAIRTAYQWTARGYDICVIMADSDNDRAAEIFRLIQPITEGTLFDSLPHSYTCNNCSPASTHPPCRDRLGPT
jgi:hypothetical protein